MRHTSMIARSHFPFAMASWWLVGLLAGFPITGFNTLAAALGGLLPDIDHPNSVVGRRVRFLSVPLSSIFGHRGFTHSLLAVVLIGAMVVHFTLEGQSLLLPVCIGYLSHILGDTLSASGVPLFYPYSKRRYKWNVLPVDSMKETAVVAIAFFLMLTIGGAGSAIIRHVLAGLPPLIQQAFTACLPLL